ncbi:hypothetical protein Q3G72_022708 [Acer saccharum]|nr:hypothetical protein Q3G72_022708 [Acer saccharum]
MPDLELKTEEYLGEFILDGKPELEYHCGHYSNMLARSSEINHQKCTEFTKFYTELELEPEDDDNSNENMNSQQTMSLEGDDGSDSEDELRIVLNSEDFKRFPVTGGGSGFNEDDDSFDQVVGVG